MNNPTERGARKRPRVLRFCGGRMLALAVLLAGLAAERACCAGATAAVIDLDETFAAVARYHYGDERKALHALQQLVVRATSLAGHDQQGFRAALAGRMAALLEAPNATPAAKVYVCGQLAEIATEAEAAALNGLLSNQPIVAAAALRALQRIPGARVDRMLRDALGRTEGELKIGVVTALGARGERAATEPLVGMLDGADEALAGAAANALGRIGGDAATRALQQALARAKGRLHGEVADACLNCAGALLAEGQDAAAGALYAQLSGAGETEAVRMAALRGMVRANPEQSIAAVCAALTSGDPALESMGLQLAREARGERATERLAECAAKVSAPVEALLLGALAARGDAAARGVVQEAMSSQDAAVRLAAINALGALGDETSVKPLLERTGAGGREGQAARNSLIWLRGAGINETMVGLLSQADAGQEAELIRILAARNAMSAVGVLEKEAAAADGTVRKEAWKALGGLAAAKDAPGLLAMLVRARDEERDDAEKAVAAVLRGTGRPDLGPVLQNLDTAETPAVRASLIRVAAAVGDDSALPALRKAVQSGDAMVRDAAVRGLAGWPTAAAMEDLLNLAHAAEEPAHRVLALRGAIRLAGKVQGRTPEQMTALLAELMQLAGAAAERKAVLAELGRHPTPEALRLAQRYAADPEVAAEAALAVKQISAALPEAPREPAAKPGTGGAAGGWSGPPEYSWKQSDGALALLNHDRVVWQFNYGADVPKPYFHPIALTDGTVLTAPSPADHPWHLALWFSWKMLNGVNYWEGDRTTGKAQGLTEVRSAKPSHRADGSARFELGLSYHPAGSPPVLTEERVIEVSAPDARGAYRIEWRGTFTAGEKDVLLQGGTAGGGYAGLSVRISQASQDWVLINSEGRRDVPTDSNPANKGGLGANTHGKRARWADFSLVDTATQEPAGIAILAHPSNPRHPPPWHNILSAGGRFGYFSPAMLWSEPFTLAAGQQFTLRYRIVVHPGPGDAEALEKEWQAFASRK